MPGTVRPRVYTSMNPEVEALIRRLGLAAHPEGGYYREIFRSPRAIDPRDGRSARAALTTIHFLLAEGGSSAWHRVASDEAWHWSGGSPLELYVVDAGLARAETILLGPMELGPVGQAFAPAHVVAAGDWQAARTRGTWTLVGCTVGPGFDFADFELLRDRTDERDRFVRRFPDWRAFV